MEDLGKGIDMEVPIHILHLNQDDPKKCTARKLNHRKLALIHESVKALPRRGVLLHPEAQIVLSPLDGKLISLGGSIIALDCSWKNVSEAFTSTGKLTNLEWRKLPALLPANPVSWGKVGRLSSAEALGATLAILGYWGQAKEMMGAFNFGEQFLQLNREPLLEYSMVRNADEIQVKEMEFF